MITVCVGDSTFADGLTLAELPPVERARVARLRQRADQRLGLATWVAATRLLAERLAVTPAGVLLDRRCQHCDHETHGRPVLPNSSLRLSVSHSGDVFAIALAEGVDVGIDVEREITEPWSDSMLELVLAPDEPVPASAERAVVWTRKEAVLKCIGDGLSAPPSGLSLEGRRVRTWSAHPDLAAQLRLLDIPAPAGYACSLAVVGDPAWRLVPPPFGCLRESIDLKPE